jgi:MFS transporter, FHS family, L-fucose permease
MFRGQDGRNHAVTFALVSTLFFLWGFCNGMIDILNRHFQNSLHISMAQSAWVQFANFIGYAVMAVPSGIFARFFGYKSGILMGLALIAVGAFWFIPACAIDTYSAFLIGLFVLAAGLAMLETIANPYTTVLGPPESGAFRINLAQTCNALGVFLGPLLAGALILSSSGEVNRSNSKLFLPYLFIVGLVVVLFVLFWRSDVPDLEIEDETVPIPAAHGKGKFFLFQWHFTLAVGAQFFYVAAQVGIWSYFLNYVTSIEMPPLPGWMVHILPSSWIFFGLPTGKVGITLHAATLAGISPAWRLTDLGGSRAFSGAILCFLAGRIVGSVVLRFCSAHLTLAMFGVMNSVMMVLIIARLGWISVAALFLSCFFMSIMYPTIFALGIRDLGKATKLASSLIVMAIIGGALLPFLMGYLADTYSMSVGFVMPLICFVYVAVYAALWPLLARCDTGHAVTD